jgi:DNA-binding NarL/FixJ family response regulator
MQPSIRLIIADECPCYLHGRQSYLSLYNGIETVALATAAPQFFQLVEQYKPNLVLMGIRLPGPGGDTICHQLEEQYPEIRKVVLTREHKLKKMFTAMDAGVCGYLTGVVPEERVVQCLREVHKGGIDYPVEYMHLVMQRLKGKSCHFFTSLQEKIIPLIAEGKTNKQMKTELFRSIHTIGDSRKEMLNKTGTHSPQEFVAWAFRHGFLE